MSLSIAKAVLSASSVVASAFVSFAVGQEAPTAVQLTVDAGEVVREFSPRRLGGTNIALWNEVRHFQSPELRQWIEDLRPGYIRLPGGSWSNNAYWNGNGVRGADGKVDPTKVGPDGYPAVDYSAYQPGFPANMDHEHNVIRPSTGYAGNVDTKTLQDWIASIPGVEPLPCLNAGTGRPIDAAEWVKWSNQTHTQYHANIWEIGNELDGSWEPGYYQLGSKKPITPEIFSERFNAIASAMKKVDPNVKIGACAFTEAMIRDCGTNVDFAAIHTYPGSSSATPQENLARVASGVKNETTRVKEWIQKYQPDRARQIELAYTEWNTSGGLNHSDLLSGLWHSLFLSEMARNGVDFATQWDIFTHTRGMSAGHALIFTDGDRYVRKSNYFAMWLWNNYTGNKQVQSSLDQPGVVYSFTSKDDDAVYLQLINPDNDREANVSVNLQNFDAAGTGERVTLSSRQYYWDAQKSVPIWSEDPQVVQTPTGKTFSVSIPPFSVTHVRIPSANKPALTPRAQAPAAVVDAGKPDLQLVLPDEIYVGDNVAGQVLAFSPGTSRPYPTPLPGAMLSSSAGNIFDRSEARLAEAVGHFFLKATEPGTLDVSVASAGTTVSKSIVVKPSEPRPVMFWDFTTPTVGDTEAFSSEFELSADPSVRANKDVAKIDIPGVTPSEKDRKRALLVVRQFPKADRLNRANIRGVTFDVRTKDIETDDPNASISVVMQSPANYWMVLGSVPLKDLDKWESKQVVTSNQKLIDAMPSTYNVWFVLNSSTPVKGTVYLDRIGLMVR